MSDHELEADLEDKVVDWAKEEGGEAVKLIIYSERGWPDRTIFLPDGKLAIPELKLPTRHKKYEQQRRRVAWLQSLGFASDFCTTLEEVKDLFRAS